MITIAMTGTEKQIAWAHDIINKPVQNAEFIIAQWVGRPGFADLESAIPAIRSAITRYEGDISGTLAPRLSSAKTVIDKRNHFAGLLEMAIQEALKAEGRKDWAIIIANLHLYG